MKKEKEQFYELLKELKLDRYKLADYLGIEVRSMNSMLSGSKPLPKWARSMLLVRELMRKQCVFLMPSDVDKFMEVARVIEG